jgi:two-component system nitrate/nitrite sensor histidine kinase NarX
VKKLLQSIVDQLAIAINQYYEKSKKESLQKNIIKIQEKAIQEREDLLRQFASDVHDLPCSIIPALKESINNKDFEECGKLVDELYLNLRQLINEYVVPDVDLLSFGSNVYQFINGFKKSFAGKVTVDLPDEEINLTQRQSIELFKVIKEWFCNIKKHSKASEVYFQLKKINDIYYLINISDNGVGFNVDTSICFGYGILNIKRRLSDINAKFEIKSRKNIGSNLKIQVGPEKLVKLS